jgi:hypothetical protein
MNHNAVVKGTTLPLKHQFAKLLLGTIAGFAATKLTEKGYETMLVHISKKSIVIP